MGEGPQEGEVVRTLFRVACEEDEGGVIFLREEF